MSTAYGIHAVPQTFFIRRDGTIAQRFYAEPGADEFADRAGRDHEAVVADRPCRDPGRP